MALPPLDDATMLKLADLLLGKVPQRPGILAVEEGIRIQTFRGKKLIETMLSPSTPRKFGLQHVTNEDTALELAHRLLNYVSPATKSYLFLPAERLKDKMAGHHVYKPIAAPQHAGGRSFDRGENSRYVWLYKGSQTRNMLWLAVLVIVVFGMCLFPLWPGFMRVAVWYLSVTLLLLLVGVTLLQFILFGVTWLFGYDFWIVPNLWSDTTSIMEAFKPAYTFSKSDGNKWYRLAGSALLLGLFAYVASQPSEFEAFVVSQKKIVDDLYAGTLLTDGSGGSSAPARSGGGFGGWQAQYGAGAYGGRRANVPDLEALKKQLEESEAAAAGEDAPAHHPAGGDSAAEGGPGDAGAPSDASPGASAGGGASAGAGGASSPDLDAMLAADDAAEAAAAGGGSEEDEGGNVAADATEAVGVDASGATAAL